MKKHNIKIEYHSLYFSLPMRQFQRKSHCMNHHFAAIYLLNAPQIAKNTFYQLQDFPVV